MDPNATSQPAERDHRNRQTTSTSQNRIKFIFTSFHHILIPSQADSVAEPELPKEPEASCFVGTIPLGISNHSGTRSFHFVRWFGVLGHRMT